MQFKCDNSRSKEHNRQIHLKGRLTPEHAKLSKLAVSEKIIKAE